MKHLYALENGKFVNACRVIGRATVGHPPVDAHSARDWHVVMSTTVGYSEFVATFKTEKDAEELCDKINTWLDQFIYYEENQ